jgi:hypothetical protein
LVIELVCIMDYGLEPAERINIDPVPGLRRRVPAESPDVNTGASETALFDYRRSTVVKYPVSEDAKSVSLPMTSSLPEIDLYRIVREQIEHEDSLISERLSWFMTSQSFLFTGYAISLTARIEVRTPWHAAQQALVFVIPVIAICTAFLFWLAILVGIGVMRRLRKFLNSRMSEVVANTLPPIQTIGGRLALALAGPVILPPLFIATWAILAVRTAVG